MVNDDETKWLFIAVFVILPGFYVVWMLVPLLIFYVLPFVAVSMAFGLLWERIARHEFRHLLLLLPLSFCLLIGTVGFPQKTLFDKKGKQYLQSPAVYHAFQKVDEWVRSPVNLVRRFFQRKAWESTYGIYDLRDLSLTLWCALLLGAPLVCGSRAQKKHQSALEKLEEKYTGLAAEEKTKHYEEKRAILDKANILRAKIKEQEEEIAKLKAVVQFGKKEEDKASETSQPSSPELSKDLKDFLS